VRKAARKGRRGLADEAEQRRRLDVRGFGAAADAL
jgi:hypothetical protein